MLRTTRPPRGLPRPPTHGASISRNEAGDRVIHPLRPQRGTTLMETLSALRDADDDFVAALEADRESPLPMQERDTL